MSGRYKKEALEQLERKQSGDIFYDEGIDKVLKYGIACYKKDAGLCWQT